MPRVSLSSLAYARSGDKGDSSNLGIIARSAEAYEFLRKALTSEVIAEHFAAICHGGVERYEIPNLHALNFILRDSLGGGGSESLITDAQGKTHGLGALYLELDVPQDVISSLP